MHATRVQLAEFLDKKLMNKLTNVLGSRNASVQVFAANFITQSVLAILKMEGVCLDVEQSKK